jgi:hypothetical protein
MPRFGAIAVALVVTCVACGRRDSAPAPVASSSPSAPTPTTSTSTTAPPGLALDCRQVDGESPEFHREFLLFLDTHRAWGDQSTNGIYEFEIHESKPGTFHGDSRARCPPNYADACRDRIVTSYEFDLGSLNMVQTHWNDLGKHGRADGTVTEVLHFHCTHVDPDKSIVAQKLADPAWLHLAVDAGAN